jgi:hypothetical protein
MARFRLSVAGQATGPVNGSITLEVGVNDAQFTNLTIPVPAASSSSTLSTSSSSSSASGLTAQPLLLLPLPLHAEFDLEPGAVSALRLRVVGPAGVHFCVEFSGSMNVTAV